MQCSDRCYDVYSTVFSWLRHAETPRCIAEVRVVRNADLGRFPPLGCLNFDDSSDASTDDCEVAYRPWRR